MSRGMDSFRAMYLDNSSSIWLVEVDDYFLQSTVSYYGLNRHVPHYSRCAAIIKGRNFDLSDMSERQLNVLAESCRILYGLLHQRYVTSEDGIRKLFSKYARGVYGCCPRTACKGRHLLPIGFDVVPRFNKVSLWCPQCHDVYKSNSDLDEAYFGPDIPIMFHKIADVPLKFKVFSSLLKKGTDDDGNEVPEIKQRLFRWGEKQLPLK
ncbi:Casein kinase II regulatory subunit family protein [Tritrichomonas foetus]|uniref:Casein kinase II subunit beta n=1 Tax=Tritrichomonas foetus TaxID=1144522 RepID=A0A1J4JPC2_9EUKA|nr:Casein kinase II regulatory subunit family protein [Tritrichomonas foetus]|eukprot:OHS99124.1 Casein kinase II regulatory subunit family protein [Tritrichomonas foetus]